MLIIIPRLLVPWANIPLTHISNIGVHVVSISVPLTCHAAIPKLYQQ